jgi:hypothetical protein
MKIMKTKITFLAIMAVSSFVNAQTVLNADGVANNTYELINSVFAPGQNAIETPDQVIAGSRYGSHPTFGRHIAEVMDTDLGKNVFEFYAHVSNSPKDNEPVNGLVDRQRVEIKTYNPSPNNLKGFLGDVVQYKWRFKIPADFLPTRTFTHIHQVKADGGDDANPIYTLTLRRTSTGSNKIQLIYSQNDASGYATPVDISLTPFLGVWVEVTETIKIEYGTSGTYSLVINKVSDGTSLMSYNNPATQTIRPAVGTVAPFNSPNSFIRPKWGIYRDLQSPSNLDYVVPTEIKDETLRFSDFSIDKGAQLSINDNVLENIDVSFPNPVSSNVKLSQTILNNFNTVSIFDLQGKLVKISKIESEKLNVSSLNPGLYLVRFESDGKFSKSVKMIKE